MEDDLTAFLEAAAGQRADWGRRDCLMFVSDWTLVRTGVDPAAPWRGRYRTEAGAARILKRGGGASALLDLGLARAGLARGPASDPSLGDIGLVERLTPRGPALVGAVFDGRGWASQMAHGLLCAPGQAQVLWRMA